MNATYYEGNRTFSVAQIPITPPAPGEVQIKVAYCGVCGTDVHIYHGVMDQRVSPPQVGGHEASATVVQVGEGVENVKLGDKVAVRPLRFGDPHPYDKGHPHVGKNLKYPASASRLNISGRVFVQKYALVVYEIDLCRHETYTSR